MKLKVFSLFTLLLLLTACSLAPQPRPTLLVPTNTPAPTLPPTAAISSNLILPAETPALPSAPTEESTSTSAPPPATQPPTANNPGTSTKPASPANSPTVAAQSTTANAPTSIASPQPATAQPTATANSTTASSQPPMVAGCPLFPANNIWNTRVDSLPVDPHSNDYIDTMGPDTGLHPDFGAGLYNGGPIGIPFTTVPGNQPLVDVTFDYEDESDPGPYPIPPDAPIEGGPDSDGDRHILIVDRDHCKLYELYAAYPEGDGNWIAGSGAIYDLNSNTLRPATWTSADAAGLPILPGLVRYDEVAAGEIRHALRFTAAITQQLFVWPARHYASDITDPTVPPMGQRFRLKASFDISPYPREVQVILNAMKTYGLILADNGSDWFISGSPDERWNNDALVSALGQIKGSNFEAVDTSSLMINPNSGEARRP